jgi:hypothetical protein
MAVIELGESIPPLTPHVRLVPFVSTAEKLCESVLIVCVGFKCITPNMERQHWL